MSKQRKTIIVGASGGIGRALLERRVQRGDDVIACARTEPKDLPDGVRLVFLDVEDESSIAAAAQEIGQGINEVIVASGVLHEEARGISPEKKLEQVEFSKLSFTFGVNAIGPIVVARHFIPLFDRDERGIFAALSARVGSIEDNRMGGWYGYRASKAALNQLLKTASIELGRSHKKLICVGLHPGTVDTALSEPFSGNVPEEKLFSPSDAAEKLDRVLEGLSTDDSGTVLDWAGKSVPA